MLVILEIALLAFVLYLIVFQLLIPASTGQKLFPAFQKDELREKVEATRDLVGTLKEQNQNLSQLQILLKQRVELEAKIKLLENPPVEKEKV